MRQLAPTTAVLSVLAALAAPAAAEPAGPSAPAPAATAPTFDVGARVGGWGYRREGDVTPVEGWQAGRMNGVGVFASRRLSPALFVEAGLDAYASADAPLGGSPMDVPADRVSGLATAAIGARMPVTRWLRGFVQAGGGVELTRISVPYGDLRIRDSRVFPAGFIGAGADLRILRRTYLGAAFRMLVMGTFTYDRARLDPGGGWIAPPTADEAFAAEAGLAAQGQFFLRHEL
jgi:hypothetical protein